MNQDQVKDLLQNLCPEAPAFTVVFTGKFSRKVNGLYRESSQEILLHNKNFSSDQELLYTAIHEMAHHLHFHSDTPPTSGRCHTKAFWLIFHGLLALAIEKGVYILVSDPELEKAIGDIRACMKREAVALKETGQALLSLVQLCGKHHVRFEDYLDRVLGISRITARVAMAAFAQDISAESGPDQVRMLAKINNVALRREVELGGGTLVEKQAAVTGVTTPKPSKTPEPLRSTERELARLQAKLAKLEEQAEEVRSRIQTLADEPAGMAAEPADRQLRFQF